MTCPPHVPEDRSDYLKPRFCNRCGAPVLETEVFGEPGWPCARCGHVQHRRPTVGVAVVVVEDGKVLLVNRGFGSKAGTWCVPCGHVGWDEDVEEAAVREAAEETGLDVSIDRILAVRSNFWRPARQTIGIWYAGRRLGGELVAGDDAVDVGFFPLDRLPATMAFRADIDVLAAIRDGNETSTGV